MQGETVESQVNLVDLPRASDPCQVQNKIIISGIDLCEGVNQGPDTSFYHATFQQASGYNLTFHFNRTK